MHRFNSEKASLDSAEGLGNGYAEKQVALETESGKIQARALETTAAKIDADALRTEKNFAIANAG